MGASSRCVGSCLLNHLKQKNVEVKMEYSFNQKKLSWSGDLQVYGAFFHTEDKTCKRAVIDAIMQDAHSLIEEKLSKRQ